MLMRFGPGICLSGEKKCGYINILYVSFAKRPAQKRYTKVQTTDDVRQDGRKEMYG